MAFQKGQSGNPKGRPRGIIDQRKLRKAIADDIPDIITVSELDPKRKFSTWHNRPCDKQRHSS